MVVQAELWQKLSDIFQTKCGQAISPIQGDSCQQQSETTANSTYSHLNEWVNRTHLKAQREWFAAIAALEQLLLAQTKTTLQGLLLSGPTPILSDTQLLSHLKVGIFTPKAIKQIQMMGFLLPSSRGVKPNFLTGKITEIPLFSQDPLLSEQFCLVLTPHFSLLMVLGENQWGLLSFHFSFEPEIVLKGWEMLRSRLLLSRDPNLASLESLIQQFKPLEPDYRLVMDFSRLLLQNLPDLLGSEAKKTRSSVNSVQSHEKPLSETNIANHAPDLELLRALTHEIRTPLTTIRTMTRLLLKRAKLTAEVVKGLEVIDQECTEQIDRMELIFRAAEVGMTPVKEKPVQLVPMSLEQIFQENIPRWQKQAQRRNVTLEVILPQKLPQVVSDPGMLDQMLTGLMEKCTRSVPSGGRVNVQVTTAGSQLKLEFHSHCGYPNQTNPLKALGQVLMFQPETGNLTLNLDVTKHLFQALGGKFTVRQKPQEGEVLTIFLPLGRGK